jgi:hypothetical protein
MSGGVHRQLSPHDFRNVLPDPSVHFHHDAGRKIEHDPGGGRTVDRQPYQERQAGRQDRLSARARRDGLADVVAVPAVDREDEGIVVQEPDVAAERREAEEGTRSTQLGYGRILSRRISLLFR